MGQMKRLQEELDWQAEQSKDEQELDFDARDAGWYRMQDAEMGQAEIDHVERQAEIQEYRTQGYGQ